MYRAYASPTCLRTAPFQIRAIIIPPPSPALPWTRRPPCRLRLWERMSAVPSFREVAVRREQVIELLRGALAPLAWVNAAWLGGSDAFGRADELSDVDLQVDLDDGHVAATFRAGEAGLGAASPTVARLGVPVV